MACLSPSLAGNERVQVFVVTAWDAGLCMVTDGAVALIFAAGGIATRLCVVADGAAVLHTGGMSVMDEGSPVRLEHAWRHGYG